MGYRHPADGRERPCDELALAVFAEHVCFDRGGSNGGFGGEDAAQAGAVEECAGANDLILRQFCILLREEGECVDRVGDEEEDGVAAERLHVVDGRGQDGLVATDEVGARVALFLRCAGGHDNDVALPCFLVCPSAYTGACVAVERGVGEVLDLGVADFLFGIDHEDIAGDGVHDEGVGDCCTDITGADNGNLRRELRVGRHGRPIVVVLMWWRMGCTILDHRKHSNTPSISSVNIERRHHDGANAQ